MTWHLAIESYLTWLAAGGTSPATIKLRRSYLHRLRCAYPDVRPGEITTDDLAAWLARPGWAPETRKSARASARSFYRWATATGKLEKSPADALPVVRVPGGQPRPAPTEALSAALALARPRERVMLMLAAYGGLRCAEIARVHTRDIENDWLRITGKGGKIRSIPLHPVLTEVLSSLPAGWVFVGQVDGHLSGQRVSDLLSDLLPAGWTAHTLRHRFASLAYANGGRDPIAVKELLGHAKLETTMRYTAVPDGALRNAVMGVS
jgi:integrase/recombinase XerC